VTVINNFHIFVYIQHFLGLHCKAWLSEAFTHGLYLKADITKVTIFFEHN